MENTCVSLGCEFTDICKHYNYLVERGEECVIREGIAKAAKRYEKNRKIKKKLKESSYESMDSE